MHISIPSCREIQQTRPASGPVRGIYMLAARATSAWRLLLAARGSWVPQQVARTERRHLRSAAVARDQAPPPPRMGRPSKTLAKQEGA
jgi:hypothetical protein